MKHAPSPRGREGDSAGRARRGPDRADALGLIGLGCLGAGLWMWWPPAALMVVGAVLVLVSLLGAWRRT